MTELVDFRREIKINLRVEVFQLENLVETGKTLLTPKGPSPIVDYETFINTKLDGFPKNYWDNSYHLCIHDLNYTLEKIGVED